MASSEGQSVSKTANLLKAMNVQYVSDEKGKKTGVLLSIKDWNRIREQLKETDFWDEIPDHVKQGIDRGQQQSMAGQTRSHEDVMEKYSKYL